MGISKRVKLNTMELSASFHGGKLLTKFVEDELTLMVANLDGTFIPDVTGKDAVALEYRGSRALHPPCFPSRTPHAA